MSFNAFAAELKVLTFNIYRKPFGGTYGKDRVRAICNKLKASDYDVVMLQEAWIASERRFLKDRCGFSFHVDIGEGGTHGIGRASVDNSEHNIESGLLILSRHPVLKSQRFLFERQGRVLRLFIDGETVVSKSFYVAKIRIDHNEIWFVNTHLAANYCEGEDRSECVSYESVRAQQLMQIQGTIQLLPDPVIFAGDFNMGDHPRSRDRIWQQFSNHFPDFRNAEMTGSTSSSRNIFNSFDLGQIDHIFASKELNIVSGRIVYDQLENVNGRSLHLSDHFAVETIFTLD